MNGVIKRELRRGLLAEEGIEPRVDGGAVQDQVVFSSVAHVRLDLVCDFKIHNYSVWH